MIFLIERVRNNVFRRDSLAKTFKMQESDIAESYVMEKRMKGEQCIQIYCKNLKEILIK